MVLFVPRTGEIFIQRRTPVSRPLCLGLKHTAPPLGAKKGPCVVRHAINRPGSSRVTSASHATVAPNGVFATQCERPSPVVCTDSMYFMNRGAFRKSRK